MPSVATCTLNLELMTSRYQIESCQRTFLKGYDHFIHKTPVWKMPGRENGLFTAWAALARRNLRLFIRGLHIKQILEVDDSPEGIISHVMT